MGKSNGLYSRTKPSSSAPKKLRGFLALSGELRNQIYQYYFDVGFRCELVAQGEQLQGQSKANTVKLWAGAFHSTTKPLRYTSPPKEESPLPIVLRVSRRLGKYDQVEALKTKWPMSLSALPLTCRQVYSETLVLLYHATVFVSSAPFKLTNFLSTAKLDFVTKLDIHYKTYADPHLNRDRKWQEKHHDAWVRACTAASKKLVSTPGATPGTFEARGIAYEKHRMHISHLICTHVADFLQKNLKELKIYVMVSSHSPRMDLRQTWLAPLLQFRRLSRARSAIAQLTTVEIDFRTPLLRRFPSNILDPQFIDAVQDLHRLFGTAIRDAILGASEEMAMKAFMEKWEGEYAIQQHGLGFAPTSW